MLHTASGVIKAQMRITATHVSSLEDRLKAGVTGNAHLGARKFFVFPGVELRVTNTPHAEFLQQWQHQRQHQATWVVASRRSLLTATHVVVIWHANPQERCS
jgi:hypothetical protein